MKRVILAIMTVIVLMMFAACGGKVQSGTGSASVEESAEAASKTSEAAPAEASSAEASSTETAAAETSSTEASSAVTDEQTPAAHSEILIAYFSATGTTKGVAERIASVTGGDLYEILAVEPYTADDLNYNDHGSRSTVEQNDKSARPEIGSEDISLEGYTTLYLGFPIWWGICPRIINSWIDNNLEQLESKTLIPFATSGSSGIDGAVNYLKKTYPTLTWQKGILKK